MASFSDYLNDDGNNVAPISGPAPQDLDNVQVVRMHERIEGRLEIPDLVEEEEVERRIKLLTPADLRHEMLLPARDAAAFLGVVEATLLGWRQRNINLPYYVAPASGKFNQRRIYYRVADLIRYREFVMTRISPAGGMHMPLPGTMGVPSTLPQ